MKHNSMLLGSGFTFLDFNANNRLGCCGRWLPEAIDYKGKLYIRYGSANGKSVFAERDWIDPYHIIRPQPHRKSCLHNTPPPHP